MPHMLNINTMCSRRRHASANKCIIYEARFPIAVQRRLRRRQRRPFSISMQIWHHDAATAIGRCIDRTVQVTHSNYQIFLFSFYTSLEKIGTRSKLKTRTVSVPPTREYGNYMYFDSLYINNWTLPHTREQSKLIPKPHAERTRAFEVRALN